MHSSDPLDWSQIRILLTVAETGSLSAAARELGLSQPTLGRQVQAAEASLGFPVFRRHAKGLALTEEGAGLIAPAREMREAAGRLALAAAGRDARLAGTVRISASLIVSHFVLPPILARLRAEAPEIELELNPTDASDNLLWREADIAIRMYRPEQGALIARHLGDSPLGLFAAESYLARRGVPETVEDLRGHDWIGLDRSELLIEGLRAYGWQMGRHDFGLRCDDQAAGWAMLAAGAGIGIGQLAIGHATPGLRRIVPDLPLPSLPLWLTAAEALRHTPRLRRVWDALAGGLAPLTAA